MSVVGVGLELNAEPQSTELFFEMLRGSTEPWACGEAGEPKVCFITFVIYFVASDLMKLHYEAAYKVFKSEDALYSYF